MDFDSEWTRCRGWIEAALEYSFGASALDDIEAQIRSGQFQFWPGKRSAAVTQIVEYPRLKALHCFLAGGDLTEILEHMEPAMIAWGRANGCTRATLAGREGWARALAPLGYRKFALAMGKEI